MGPVHIRPGSVLEKWLSLVVLSYCWLDWEIFDKSTSSHFVPLLKGIFQRKGKKKQTKTNSWLRLPWSHNLETFLYFAVLPKQIQEVSSLSKPGEWSWCSSFIYQISPAQDDLDGFVQWLFVGCGSPLLLGMLSSAGLLRLSSLLGWSRGCPSPGTIPVPSHRLPHCAPQLHSWQGECWWLGTFFYFFFSKKNIDSSSSSWN